MSNRLTVTRIDRIEIPESPPTLPPEIDVDLDAKDDKSECSTDSKASVSTSGVSSLLPRNSRNEGTSMRKNIFPRPPLSDYRHEYFSRRDSGSSKRPSCSTTELWSDLDTTKRPPSCASQPVRKRMRTDSSQSDLSSAFSSPFYRGRVSYGGASSLRGMTKPQSVFEVGQYIEIIMWFECSHSKLFALLACGAVAVYYRGSRRRHSFKNSSASTKCDAQCDRQTHSRKPRKAHLPNCFE